VVVKLAIKPPTERKEELLSGKWGFIQAAKKQMLFLQNSKTKS
jgi:hypothetical protein